MKYLYVSYEIRSIQFDSFSNTLQVLYIPSIVVSPPYARCSPRNIIAISS